MNAPWSCQYFLYACNDPTADNYVSAFNTLAANLHLNGNGVIASPMPPATVLAGMCQYGGCNDTAATNYNSRVRACAIRCRLLPCYFSRLACLAPPSAVAPLPPHPVPAVALPPSQFQPSEGSNPPTYRAIIPMRARARALTVRTPPMRV